MNAYDYTLKFIRPTNWGQHGHEQHAAVCHLCHASVWLGLGPACAWGACAFWCPAGCAMAKVRQEAGEVTLIGDGSASLLASAMLSSLLGKTA